jgi:hypothetical protein
MIPNKSNDSFEKAKTTICKLQDIYNSYDEKDAERIELLRNRDKYIVVLLKEAQLLQRLRWEIYFGGEAERGGFGKLRFLGQEIVLSSCLRKKNASKIESLLNKINGFYDDGITLYKEQGKGKVVLCWKELGRKLHLILTSLSKDISHFEFALEYAQIHDLNIVKKTFQDLCHELCVQCPEIFVWQRVYNVITSGKKGKIPFSDCTIKIPQNLTS